MPGDDDSCPGHPDNAYIDRDALPDEARHRIVALEQALEVAQADAQRYKQDHLNACALVADMHAAAMGVRGGGPVRGVVEDIADLRTEAAFWRLATEKALRLHHAEEEEHDITKQLARGAAYMAKAYIELCISDGLGGDEEEVQDALGQVQIWIDRLTEEAPEDDGSAPGFNVVETETVRGETFEHVAPGDENNFPIGAKIEYPKE